MTKNSNLKCNDCNLRLKTMGLFKRHMETTHKSKSIKQTEKETNEKQSNEARKLCCDLCEMEMINNSHLKRHLESAHGGDKYIYCTKCDFRSSSRVQHIKHMKTAHGETRNCQNYLFCEVCNFRAVSQTNLTKHIQVAHSQDKTKVCEFYLRGNCVYGERCFFSHRENEDIPCWYQGDCLRNNCYFTHYEHFLDQNNQPQNPPIYQGEVWRPW